MTGFTNREPADAGPGSTWRKSTYSGAQGNCVEVSHLASGEVAVRNSRDPGGPPLVFTAEEMDAFIAGVKDGEFDRSSSPSTFQVDHDPEGAQARHQAIGSELHSIVDRLAPGETVLGREDAEKLMRVLGAVALLHRMHRVDRRGRCTICSTKSSRLWGSRQARDLCSVHSALSLHLGRTLAAFGYSPAGDPSFRDVRTPVTDTL